MVYRHLAPLLDNLRKIDFLLRVEDPAVNRGQIASDFDAELEKALLVGGGTPFEIRLPPNVPQELDFALAYGGRSVAVEIEKANREKILRDILKCHMYLHAGADFAMVVLPKNYSHSHGVWNLFDFGVQRFQECLTYGFGAADTLDRILLLGFEQFVASTNAPLSQKTRLARHA
ncbi:hypothetical protein SBA4_1970004 [Candidatus Sulfopaludibacter sp. SbA4]|nr:hypothetical protein SBA4_1970004 [Candidatus Sulfopaludibacter sp. SbA4]